MSKIELENEQWHKIVVFLQQHPKVYVGNKAECRRFLTAVLWVMRSGAQWRLLPTEYGKWNSVYKRFSRWCDEGVWQAMHEHVADDPDMEHILLDSTIIRAHPCAAGAPAKKGGNQPKPWAVAGVASAPRFMSRSMPWAIHWRTCSHLGSNMMSPKPRHCWAIADVTFSWLTRVTMPPTFAKRLKHKALRR